MKNTNNTFRKAKMAKILSLISESGIIEEIMGSKGLDMKSVFFKSLSPIGREAFKLAYQIIDNEHYVLVENEDTTIRENWYTHFIEYHNNILEKLSPKKDGDIFEFAITEFGDDYINNVFRQDVRSLEEIVDIVGEKYVKAQMLKEQQEQQGDNLKEKLHTQLQDVVATLNEMTAQNTSKNKNFEIHTEGAIFNITTNSEGVFSREECGDGDFEHLIKKLFENIGK